MRVKDFLKTWQGFIKPFLSPMSIVYFILLLSGLYIYELISALSIGVALLTSYFLSLNTPLLKLGKRNKYIYRVRDELHKKSTLKRKKLLFEDPIKTQGSLINATAGYRGITLSTDLVNAFDQNPKIIDYLLGHEITHFELADIKLQTNLKKKMFKKDKQALEPRTLHILTEIRADICSVLRNNFSSEEYTKIINKVAEVNDGEGWRDNDKEDSYTNGYPSRKERIEYPLKCIELRIGDILNKENISKYVVSPLILSVIEKHGLTVQEKNNLIKQLEMKFFDGVNLSGF